MAVIRVEKSKNYTVMSNYHLKDKTLSLKSKGLLSLILSLPDEWNYTTRGLATICKEGVDCIGTSLRELEATGYLKRNKLRDERGRIKDTEYIIYEFPQENSHTDKPCTNVPHTETPYMDEPPAENAAEYNIDNKPNKKDSNTELGNNYQSISHRRGQGSYQQPPNETPVDMIDEMMKYREIIKENIDYDCLADRYDPKMIDEIVEIMSDYICGKRESVRIGKAEYPPEAVKNRLLTLDSSHIEYVIGCIKSNTTKIGNIKAYLVTALYNAPSTIDHYYTTLVNHDMANLYNKN